MALQSIVGITGDIKHLDAGARAGQDRSHLRTAHLWHHHVGDQQIDCSRVLLRQLWSRRTVAGGQNTMARFGEHIFGKHTHRGLARIDLVNYDIQVLGTDTEAGLTLYVLGLEPKSKSPYLVRGRAWVDVSEYALVRLEGVVAKKPSIWVGSPVVQLTYIKSGPFWLPDKNLSTTDAPLFGKT